MSTDSNEASVQSVVMRRELLGLGSGYFEMMRRNHPVLVGQVIDGKRVIRVCWEWTLVNGNRPIYQLEGECDSRVWPTGEIVHVD